MQAHCSSTSSHICDLKKQLSLSSSQHCQKRCSFHNGTCALPYLSSLMSIYHSKLRSKLHCCFRVTILEMLVIPKPVQVQTLGD